LETTICCSAVALTLLLSLALEAARGATTPLSLFPIATLWTLSLNNALAAPPAYEGRHAFFAIEGARIVAYDLATGARTWLISAATAIAPAASPDLLFVVEDDALVAFRVGDGSVAWQLPFSETLALPLVWDNGWLVACTVDGNVIAFRASDGAVVWRQSLGSAAHAPPALAADRVYIPTGDGRVVALRVDTGARLWEHRLGGAANEILALDERLYVGSTDNFLYCLKTEDGEQAWRVRTGADVIGLPVIDEHAVYFVSLDNVLRALNRSNGNQRWKRALPLRPTSGPIRAAQALLVTGVAEKLPAYGAGDGTPAGDVAPGGEIAAPPHVLTLPGTYGPVVIVVTRDIVKGATVKALTRSIEPLIVTPIGALPNPVSLTPNASPPTVPKP